MDVQSSDVTEKLAENTFTREGYAFMGWNEAEDGTGVSYDDLGEFAFDRDVTLFAQWEAIPAGSADSGSSGSSSLSSTGLNLPPSQALALGALTLLAAGGTLLTARVRRRRS